MRHIKMAEPAICKWRNPTYVNGGMRHMGNGAVDSPASYDRVKPDLAAA